MNEVAVVAAGEVLSVEERTVDSLIASNERLGILAAKAQAELESERQRYCKGILDTVASGRDLFTRVVLEWSLPQEGLREAHLRIYRLVQTTTFREAWSERRIGDVASTIIAEIYIVGPLASYAFSGLKPFVEKNLAKLRAWEGLKGLGSTQMSCLLAAAVGAVVTVAAVSDGGGGLEVCSLLAKVAVAVSCNALVAIPVANAIDDFKTSFKYYRIRREKRLGPAVARAAEDVVHKAPVLGDIAAAIVDYFRVVEDISLYPGYHVHPVFCCPITLEPLRDPVFLRGFVFSRPAIETWIADVGTHPFTRVVVTKDMLAAPTPFFLKKYHKYFRKRKDLVLAEDTQPDSPADDPTTLEPVQSAGVAEDVRHPPRTTKSEPGGEGGGASS